MSEPKLISPLLDNFVMGDPVSEHDGVRCCPAMQHDSDKKYIVKIISIPAERKNLDALLLAGAFSDEASAQQYFRELADGIIGEAEVLQKLASLEGFISYEGWQIEPMEDGTGFDVYLVGAYRRTLERNFRRDPLTHLGAVNLGLDMCAALAVARRCGYLCVDLKPTNIFVCEDKEYRIGDIGFVKLDSLQFASLPERCLSSYTPPEVADAYSALNATMDIYAAGLILYQTYNNGALPVIDPDNEDPIPAPQYADYEMAEIILKAIATDPSERWQDPIEMGKALVSYMQRNSVNDVPIAPPAIAAETPKEEINLTDTAAIDIALIQMLTGGAEVEDSEAQPSEDISEMLAQADELIAMETPEPVVAPEAVEITIPVIGEADVSEDEDKDAPIPVAAMSAAAQNEQTKVLPTAPVITQAATTETPEEEPMEEEAPEEEMRKPKRSWRGVVAAILIILLLLCAAVGCYGFYKYYYIQPVNDLALNVNDQQVTITVTSQIDDQLLTIVCTDPYGTTFRAALENGKATFTNLNSATTYKFRVEIQGFRKLIGETEITYTTAEQTTISDLKVIAGTEDGSVQLSFKVSGPDSSWQVVYSAQGEEEKTVSCANHAAVIQGLTVGKEYTFRLVPATALYIVGEDTAKFVATNMIYAENLAITSFFNGTLTATWKTPIGVNVGSWSVRCYNTAGYDTTITAVGNSATFEGLDPAYAYTVEVTAEGMQRGVNAYVTENVITVQGMNVVKLNANELKVSWQYAGKAPAGGWRILYKIDGSKNALVATSDTASVILPLVPGSHYEITVAQATGNTVFNGTTQYDTQEAAQFSDYHYLDNNVRSYKLCHPTTVVVAGKGFDTSQLTFTTEFAPGAKASIYMFVSYYYTGNASIRNLFVMRDEAGAVVSVYHTDRIWDDMLEGGHGIMNLQAVPSEPGNYTVDVFYNGGSVTSLSFSVK